jgi:hypothetical protein
MCDTEQIGCGTQSIAPLCSIHFSSFRHLETAMANSSVGDGCLDNALVDSQIIRSACQSPDDEIFRR